MGRLKRRWRKWKAQRELRRKYVDANLGPPGRLCRVGGKVMKDRITQNYWNSLKAEQEEKEMQQLQKNMDRVGWTMLVVAGVLMLAIVWIQVGKWYGW